ncbi:hypothetical protein B0J11DRAFT_23349 [Dendryphion nanum]|uniref:Uncharacterized protein n=1 Tax=Dendryphion nanum TaxID=256645 RepID=A0A9P9IYQ0_9PLEO|nr:hypothetical protein B0J11DRAFT_23349 [Dendryphion nanum]
MPVTVIPSNAEPRAYNHEGLRSATLTPTNLFQQSCPNEAFARKQGTTNREIEKMMEGFRRKREGIPPVEEGNETPEPEIIPPEVHFSSWEDGSRTDVSEGNIYSSSDSFIRGAIDAWAQHQHLVIRPDEVWFAILVQMNFYMCRESETLRDLFVTHAGKQSIHVEDFTFENVLWKFKNAIQKRVKTGWLQDWIIPNFSTTEEEDVLTASVLMMGLMQRFFDYSCSVICGLPSVTLLGERSDWEKLLAKLDRMQEFGKEPETYATQLRPILSRFVQTFDTPDDPEIRNFWDDIVNPGEESICGYAPYFLQGWLVGFLFWDDKGEKLDGWRESTLGLDGVQYLPLDIDRLPVGYAKAPLTIKDFKGQAEYNGHLVAGNLGKEIVSNAPEGYAEALRRFNGNDFDASLPHGTIRPLSGWMFYGPTEDGDGEQSNNNIEEGELIRVIGRGGPLKDVEADKGIKGMFS